MTNSKKVMRIGIYILLVVAILAILIPVIIGAGYTYPCEDDFGFEAGGKIYANKYGNLLGAFIGAYEYYVAWQGTYVANFLWYFIRAYDRWGIIGFHFVMILILLLFIFSVFLLIKTLIKDKLSMLLILLATYIVIFNSSPLGLEKEFFYWYTGALNFQLEFALACITLALTLRLINENHKKQLYFYMIAAAFTGFLASGGALEVTSFNCSWLLLTLVLHYKKIPNKKTIAVPFAASFLGALINACAKGNFVRNNTTMGDLNYGVLDAIKDTFICWRNEWNAIFCNKFLIVLFVLIFIGCLICKTHIFKNGISTGRMLLLALSTFLIQYFTAFPVILGYHGSDLVRMRTTYTYELLAKLMFLFLIICFAQWLREHLKQTLLIPICIALAVVIFVISSNNVFVNISNGFSYQAAKELRSGTIQELYEFRLSVLTHLDQSEKNTDVHLKVPSVPSSNIMYGMGITTDPNCTCNRLAARYYGFNSLIIEYSDEYEFTDF